MSTTYPTTKQSITNPSSTDTMASPSHSAQHIVENDTIEALQDKVGLDNSSVETTLDYKLTNPSSSNPGHKHTLADGASNVTATYTELNQITGKTLTGSDTKLVTGTEGDAYGDMVWDTNGDAVGLETLVGAGDGVTDDTDTLNSFLTANAGKAVRIPAGNYLVTGTIAIPASTTVYAYGARIFDNSTHKTLVTMLSDSNLFGMEIEGVGNDSYDNDGRGISIIGESLSEKVNIVIRDCDIHDFGGYGIFLEQCTNVQILTTSIQHCGYAGVQTISCEYVNIDKSYIKDIYPGHTGTGNDAYGVAFTQWNDSGSDRSQYCSVTNSWIEDVTGWEGLDTHGGRGIKFENNTIKGCSRGIVLKTAPSSGTADTAASDCIIRGNTIYGGGNLGLYITGLTNLYTTNNIVESNVFIECGEEGGNSIDTGAMYFGYTYNTIISNNMIQRPYGSGIIMRRDNYGFVVSGNLIKESQNTVENQTVGIYVYVNNVGLITNNQLYRVDGSVNDYVGELGIYVDADAENNITLGPNKVNFTVPMSISDERVDYGKLSTPRARAFAAVNQENLVNTTPTKVTLGTEDYDIGDNFTSSSFTAPITGYYKIKGSVTFLNVVADKLYVGQIYKATASIKDDYVHASLAQSLTSKPEITTYLTAGDVISLYATSYSGDNTVDITLGSKYTSLEVEFIGD